MSACIYKHQLLYTRDVLSIHVLVLNIYIYVPVYTPQYYHANLLYKISQLNLHVYTYMAYINALNIAITGNGKTD